MKKIPGTIITIIIRTLIVALALILGTATCLAQVTNTRTGLVTSTIQAGINAASAGDVLEIEPGTYPETLRINKHLALICKQTVPQAEYFTLAPDLANLTINDSIVHITFFSTVTISRLRVEDIREADGQSPAGVRSVITNNGYLSLQRAYIAGNRTREGAIVNKGDGTYYESGELFMDTCYVVDNLGGLGSPVGPGGGLKNHGRLEAQMLTVRGNDGLYGGLFNSGGETFFFASALEENLGDYGAYFNAVENGAGAVLGYFSHIYDNYGAIASDFRDPNRGDWLDPSLGQIGDCGTQAPPSSVNPCGTYDSPEGHFIDNQWVNRGLYWF